MRGTNHSTLGGGYVYVLSNPAMPGLYKVGCTMDLAQRRLQLSRETSAPRPFQCEYAIFAEKYVQLEKAVHQRLDHVRLRGKEFFECELSRIIHELQQASLELVADGDRTQQTHHQQPQVTPKPPLESRMTDMQVQDQPPPPPMIKYQSSLETTSTKTGLFAPRTSTLTAQPWPSGSQRGKRKHIPVKLKSLATTPAAERKFFESVRSQNFIKELMRYSLKIKEPGLLDIQRAMNTKLNRVPTLEDLRAIASEKAVNLYLKFLKKHRIEHAIEAQTQT